VDVARLRHEPEREQEGCDADGHVDEEDPRPGEVLRQRAAEDEADRRAADRDCRPHGKRAGTLGALLEGGRDDRERGGRDQRGAEALQRPRPDQHALAAGEPIEERGAGEDDEADQEKALAAQQVAKAAAEEQEAAEDEGVGVDDPLQTAVGEVEVRLDRRQGDVHDRRVEDDHELRQADEDEDDPRVGGGASHGCTPSLHSSKFFHQCRKGTTVLHWTQICAPCRKSC
jgi:hypothetical protein